MGGCNGMGGGGVNYTECGGGGVGGDIHKMSRFDIGLLVKHGQP